MPESELAWSDLSEAALTLAACVDGTKTLHDLLYAARIGLEAVGQLYDAGLLKFEA